MSLGIDGFEFRLDQWPKAASGRNLQHGCPGC